MKIILEAGATIVDNCRRSLESRNGYESKRTNCKLNMVISVKDLILFTYLHLAPEPELTKALLIIK